MADPEQLAVNGATLEALQRQSQQHSRRLRPPDFDGVVGDENRVPLRADKLHRRESRIGLSRIFGRSKSATKELPETTLPYKELSRPGGIRASLAEISNWPYSLHGTRSELVLPVQARPMSTVAEAAPLPSLPPIKHKKSTSGGRQSRMPPPTMPPPPPPPVKSTRGSLATWDPPPLFQAYPQAIRHAQLPALTLSADAVLRLNERKGSVSIRDDLTQDPLSPDLVDDLAGEKSEKTKRKHRRNMSGSSSSKSDWTTKIYVLVTSGYLLQYAGEGSFDRLPEKMLHLGKDSAAIASDLIPGRHWVLQVSSVMDAEGNVASDSRSLFSRLAFRGVEKRHASNFLMVFEGADDMEAWITILRREIEALGGKKKLSETGKPKADDNVVELRAQPSQRTLVVRDPERFSRIIAQDFTWHNAEDDDDGDDDDDNDATPSPDDADGSLTVVVDADAGPETGLDDVSTTASVVSHDGRQLESLRDSQHRLSYISSGQRTIVTSADSSPACSPTRDSFASQVDEVPVPPASSTAPVLPFPEFARLEAPVGAARPRPNAAAILDRRQSMMTMNPFMEPPPQRPATTRPHSTYGASSLPDAMTLPTTLNFSVPHAVSRRYSLAKSPSLESAPFPGATMPTMPTQERELPPPPPRPMRRAPPTSLPISRPLSIVADQPSPILDEPPAEPRPVSRRNHGTEAPLPAEPRVESRFEPRPESRARPESKADSRPTTRSRADSANRVANSFDVPSRWSSLVTGSPVVTVTVRTSGSSPRKYASMHSLRQSDEIKDFQVPPIPSIPSSPPPPSPSTAAEEPLRCRSSMDQYGRSRSRSPSSVSRTSRHGKRASLASVGSDKAARFSVSGPPPSDMAMPGLGLGLASPFSAGGPPRSATALGAASAHHHLSVDFGASSKALLNRRSMPHLVDGPPPLPPPTCALPPIPQKLRART